jgi:uronate dehydrogenase
MGDDVLPQTVLLTGAAGQIGSEFRRRWQGRFTALRLTDLRELGAPGPREEVVRADLSDWDETLELVRGVDAIVHLAAIPDEDSFPRLVQANIVATYNIFEAARLCGTRRVVFASTNHVTGYYRSDEQIAPTDLPRPDTLYGATKALGELLGRLYRDKFGLEVVCVRIGSFRPEPTNVRYLSTWLSPGDAARIFLKAVTATEIGFLTVYGVSRTSRPYWLNESAASALGYSPEDDSETFAEHLASLGERVNEWPHQGGNCAVASYHGDERGAS